MPVRLVYKQNPKHKRGVQGAGPPRWFPDADSLCPDDITQEVAQDLLERSIPGTDSAHPESRARFALCAGRFFKAYRTEQREGEEIWHGYPVRRELVRTQIPTRILRQFVEAGDLPRSEYKRPLGSAR